MNNNTQDKVPELRFPEFEGEWKTETLGAVASFSKGKGISKADISENGATECIRYGELYTEYSEVITEVVSQTDIDEAELILSKKNDVIIPASGETQIDIATASCITKSGVALGGDLNIIKSAIDGIFLSYYLNNAQKTNIARLSQGISVIHLYASQLKSLNIHIPEPDEQTRIANFLTAVDKRINLLQKKKAELEQYKKGVMQKIFSQELRFKDENGNDFSDWEEKQLKKLFNRIREKNKENNKNVLTISAQMGLVGQLNFFNNSVAGKDVRGYYLLKRNDFAYNRSYSKGYPMGAIKRLKYYDKGIVSTLYLCFRSNENIDNCFAEQLFESGTLNKELYKIVQEGARNHGLLNLNTTDFFEITIKTPKLPEQQKIASFLSSIDKKIEKTEQQIEASQQWKKGLLQKMFV